MVTDVGFANRTKSPRGSKEIGGKKFGKGWSSLKEKIGARGVINFGRIEEL